MSQRDEASSTHSNLGPRSSKFLGFPKRHLIWGEHAKTTRDGAHIYIYTSRSYLDQILPHHRTIMCTVNLHMEKTPSFWCQSQNTPEPIGRTPRSRSELRSPHGARKRRRARSRSHNTRDLMMGAPLQWCCARSFSSITIQRTWGWKWSSGCWQAAGGGFVFEGPE